VKCRSCSADIDAKAIVCYRCGAPTDFIVAGKPEATMRSSAVWRWAAALILLGVAIAACVYYWQVKG